MEYTWILWRESERSQHVIGWTWKHLDCNWLSPIISLDTGCGCLISGQRLNHATYFGSYQVFVCREGSHDNGPFVLYYNELMHTFIYHYSIQTLVYRWSKMVYSLELWFSKMRKKEPPSMIFLTCYMPSHRTNIIKVKGYYCRFLQSTLYKC